MTTATSGVLARFPWLLPIRNPLRVTGPLPSLVLRAEQKKCPWAEEYQNNGLSWISPNRQSMGQSLHGPALSSCKSMGRHCADNNAGAQRYLFSGWFSDIWRSRHSASSGYSIKGRSLIARGWSPVRSHLVYVRGGHSSLGLWEESQVLAALAVSELSAALQ